MCSRVLEKSASIAPVDTLMADAREMFAGFSEQAPPIICITSRKCCTEPFLRRMERIASAHVHGIVLREKDLSPASLVLLARRLKRLCAEHGVSLAINAHPCVAGTAGCTAIHLPLPSLRMAAVSKCLWKFHSIGVSVHSPEEAREAACRGATHLFAGHVFDTNCKAGIAPRGLDFLHSVCTAVTLPVYAIGGIAPDNLFSVRQAGAAGACLMSSLMSCPDPAVLLSRLHTAWNGSA